MPSWRGRPGVPGRHRGAARRRWEATLSAPPRGAVLFVALHANTTSAVGRADEADTSSGHGSAGEGSESDPGLRACRRPGTLRAGPRSRLLAAVADLTRRAARTATMRNVIAYTWRALPLKACTLGDQAQHMWWRVGTLRTHEGGGMASLPSWTLLTLKNG